MLARELAGDALLHADIDRLRGRIDVNVSSATDAHRIFMQAARAAAQDRLAALSINSSHRIADATHGGLLDDPHGAAVAVRAITDVVRSASTRASLTRP